MVATAAPSTAPIVVAIAFDKPSVYALRRGAEIFRRSPAFELELLHVVEEVGDLRDTEQRLARVMRESSKRIEDFVHAKLGDRSAIEGRRVGIHVRTGNVAQEIVKFAEEAGAQLVVVGSHARQGVLKKLLGSTSEKVLEISPVSVLLATGDASTESPAIEPLCPECRRTRATSRGEQWWCSRHTEHHAHGHTVSYRRQWPFAVHDSEVVPTGVDVG
jgi:nucleotide-binding universal stress UspA family protein